MTQDVINGYLAADTTPGNAARIELMLGKKPSHCRAQRGCGMRSDHGPRRRFGSGSGSRADRHRRL
jgi:hypothetical protein